MVPRTKRLLTGRMVAGPVKGLHYEYFVRGWGRWHCPVHVHVRVQYCTNAVAVLAYVHTDHRLRYMLVA